MAAGSSARATTARSGSGTSTAEKEIEPRLTLDGGATAVAMSRSGLVAVGGENGKAWLWDPDVAGSQRTVLEASASITDVALSPDGSLLAVIVRDGPLTVLDAATGETKWTLPGPYRGAAFGGRERPGRRSR